SAPYRPVLAKWLTSPKNPYFARAMVNRVWAHFFGRGLVNPVDDMHDKNPASHPLLLEAMAEQFAAVGFAVNNLIHAISNSETYQRTRRPSGGNEADEALFSHMAIKVMAPEVLYDSLEAVVGSPGRAAAAARRNQPAQANRRGPAGPRAAFVAFFRVDD